MVNKMSPENVLSAFNATTAALSTDNKLYLTCNFYNCYFRVENVVSVKAGNNYAIGIKGCSDG